MGTTDLVARQSRAFERLVGVVATVIGAALLFSAAFVVYRSLGKQLITPLIALLCAAFAFGMLLFVAGVRLITGKHRSDGGLFSPWILRLGGLFFLFMPVVLLVAHRSWFLFLEGGVSLSAGVACFALANRREERARELNVPKNRWSGP